MASLGVLVGVAAGAYRWRDPTLTHYPTIRAAYVHNLIAQSGPVDTLILGDSISESTLLDGVCGKTFNASVGAARVPTAYQLGRFAVPRLRPKLVVVEIGTNYFAAGDDAQFYRDYPILLRQLAGHRLILVGTPRSVKATAWIERTAQALGAQFVPPVTGRLTFEGVHPTPEGGRVYRQRLANACAKAH